MKTIEISVEGRRLPLRATMGAMKDFKKMTGRDSKDMDMASPVDITTFLYCCICSACRKDKVKFDMSLEDFMDSVDVDTINGWSTELSAATAPAQADGGTEGGANPQKEAGAARR